MFGGGLRWVGGACTKVSKRVLDAEREQRRLFAWRGFICISSDDFQVNFIWNKDGGGENHFQMSNCVFCLMPGIDRKVLISCTDICLKVAFDLNFNLQTVAGEKDLFIRFQQHNKMSCSSATIYHHWRGNCSCLVASVAMASICLSETTKGGIVAFALGWTIAFPWLAQAACAAFHENNSLAWLKHLSRASKN